MSSLTDFELTSTIRDFDFTKRAIQNMNRILDSDAFAEMDSDAIFNYLQKEMEIVSFKDYLRRYIYNQAGFPVPFGEVSEEDYLEIIMDSFRENDMVFSFTPTTRRNRAFARIWLNQDNATRTTLFTIAFGLGMSDADVSEFLTKVLKEDDFDLRNPDEVIFMHCYHHHFPYRRALQLQQYYAELPAATAEKEQLWEAMRTTPSMYIYDGKMIGEYLEFLKCDSEILSQGNKLKDLFNELYDRVRHLIAEKYWAKENVGSFEDITPGDVEKILCSGVPMGENGNLAKMSLSVLSKQFQQKRMSRQRTTSILKGKQKIERFDLITLLFFIYAVDVEPDWPTERYLQFIDEINQKLREVGMSDIYPVNPYEAFVLMCLLADTPLSVYGEIWEMSYEE